MTRTRLGLLAAAAWLLAPLVASATPVVYTISDQGLDGGFACTGTVGACPNLSSTNVTFEHDAPAPPDAFDAATGTITLDAMAGTVSFSVDVAAATFLATGGADNGVDEIVFTNLNYSATLTGVSFVPDGFGNTTISWAAQTPGSTSVSGDYEQLLAGGTVNGPDAFAVTARVSAGVCTLTALDSLTCGFIFGPGGFTLPVGSDASPQDRRFVHTLNLVAVPEPGTVMLLAIGLAGVALRRRDR